MRMALYLTEKCPFDRGYCFDHVGCSSRGVRNIYLEARDYISRAGGLGFDTISFSGGEPTSDLEKLNGLIGLAKSLGLKTRMKTSAYWNNYAEVAQELYDSGLDYIRVFYDSKRRYEDKILMFNSLREISSVFKKKQFKIIAPRGEADFDLLSEIALVESLPYPDQDFEFKEIVSGIEDRKSVV